MLSRRASVGRLSAQVYGMNTYRRIEAEPRFAEYVWNAEQRMPEWFKAASRAWTPTLVSFVEFWKGCDNIFGLFPDDRPDELLAVIYVETLEVPEAINVHVSVLSEVPHAEIGRFFRSVKALKSAQGVRRMHGWPPRRGKGLLTIAQAAGFEETGLKRLYGNYRGKVLEWVELRG